MRFSEFVELLKLIFRVMGEIGLPKLLHFTTLQKFMKRIGTDIFDAVLNKTRKLFDTDKRVILAHRMRKGPKHDSVDAKLLTRKTKKLKQMYNLDKGFDRKSVHEIIKEGTGTESQISVRNSKALTGEYRQLTMTEIGEAKYHRRSIVECVFPIEKRVFGMKTTPSQQDEE